MVTNTNETIAALTGFVRRIELTNEINNDVIHFLTLSSPSIIDWDMIKKRDIPLNINARA
jgi:hypothetical protein